MTRKRSETNAATPAGSFRDRVVGFKRIRASELKRSGLNWRTHPSEQQDAMRAVLGELGFAGAVLGRETEDGIEIIDGHLRADLGGDHELPVIVTNLSEHEAKQLLAVFDPLSAMAGADPDALSRLLGDVAFTSPDLQQLLDDLAREHKITMGEVNEDEAPAPLPTPVTRRGDLWVLGDHRLLCGDSASESDVDRLVNGQVVHMVNTDPPYNVRVEPRSNNAIAAGLSSFTSTHHQTMDAKRDGGMRTHPTGKTLRAKDRPLANDFVSDEDFQKMLRAWFGNLSRVLVPGGSFYVWGGYANLGNYPGPLRARGLYFSQGIVWDKQHPVLTRKDYMGAFELCFYGWKEGAAHSFYGPSNVPDLWQVQKLHSSKMVHLTEKPVELAARAMRYSSRSGENVLDLFGGSGSTLVAAEQLKRRAFLMEIDPAYCDVIVMRWQSLTGMGAILESDGRTWKQIASQRGVDVDGQRVDAEGGT